MEANLEEIVLDDSIVEVQEVPSETEEVITGRNSTITLDDTLESMESTDHSGATED